ncbi:MAG: class I SAM-dependent DNA methyltransferase, partial [Actinomycetota bacterium]
FGFHADDCAPGILTLLEPVRQHDGVVVELGCGSGLLTKYLIDGGHRVIATDASPAMLEIAHGYAGEAQEIRQLILPDDPIPEADAIVSVGHVLNYLSDADAIDRALVAIARALRPGGLLAIDLCDLTYAEAKGTPSTAAWVTDDWAIVTERSSPSPDRFIRQMATFMRNEDSSWRRDDERHENVLIDTTLVPELLERHGVSARLEVAFGSEQLPQGLHTVVGHRSA